jgi:UDP-2-acetamido-3-amino-2,3-dideoxy-glucuronate N-acetyltransferase
MEKKYFVHESSYVDDNVELGEGTKVWHFSHVQGGSVIGKNCSLGQNVNIGNNVSIGNNVKIQNNVSVYEGVELEDYVFCGPSMVFTNIMNPRSEFPQRGTEFYLKTLIKKSASLGANSTIVCGNTVGKYAFVGAGTVVTRDIPDYAMVVGTPAKQIAWVCACGNKLSLTNHPETTEEAVCSKCKREYKKNKNIVEQIEK